jgi:hypothetical protein
MLDLTIALSLAGQIAQEYCKPRTAERDSSRSETARADACGVDPYAAKIAKSPTQLFLFSPNVC